MYIVSTCTGRLGQVKRLFYRYWEYLFISNRTKRPHVRALFLKLSSVLKCVMHKNPNSLLNPDEEEISFVRSRPSQSNITPTELTAGALFVLNSISLQRTVYIIMVKSKKSSVPPLTVWPEAAPSPGENKIFSISIGNSHISWCIHESVAKNLVPTLFWR